MLKFGKVLNNVIGKFTLVSFVGVVAIMLLNVADVLSSKLFLKPIAGAYEVTQLLMLCTVIGSYAYGQTNHTHINMGLIILKFPKKARYFISGVLGILSTATAVVLGYAACKQAMIALGKNTVTGALFIPWWPFYIIEGICMFILAVTLAYDMLMSFRAIAGEEEIEKYVDSTFS